MTDSIPITEEGFSKVSGIIETATEVPNPLKNLVERCKKDIGEAYKPEVVDALSDLQCEDMAAFMSLRQSLKKLGVGVGRLDGTIKDRDVEKGRVERDPDHLELARDVIGVIGYDNILSTDSHVWMWKNNGVWQTIPDRLLKQKVQKILDGRVRGVFRGLVDSVTEVLKTLVYRAEHAWNQQQDTVNVLNGELSWNGKNWDLQPHCREHFRTTQIPVEYDASAECPRFKLFLEEIFEGDSDKKDKAQLILEMIGYTLVSQANLERFILLIGSGANGKSVILEVIRLLVGVDNVAAVQPSQFSNKFQRAYLHLKLVNLVTELSEGEKMADAELKAITSGELITAEHKNKDPFSFSPFCTCWFGSNHMPHTRDFSEALFRRALVVPFNNTFKEGVNADPHLKDKLKGELPGIMNLALQAFGKVLKRKSFTEPRSCLDAKLEWRKEIDQVVQFIDDKCILDLSHKETSASLYDAYCKWVQEVGIRHKLNHKNFTNRLLRVGCEKSRGAGGVRLIIGIKLK